jgi:Flp pilus assembly pilin Flp
MRRPSFKRILRDESGLSTIEFAILAPTLLVMLMGTFDLSHTAYVHTVLEGELNKAGRDATLAGGNTGSATTSLDNRVKTRVNNVIGSGTWTFSHKRYPSFTRAGQAENFTDTNNNGVRNAGECFQDENGNLSWDSDGGTNGQGSGDDIVVYKAKVVYPRLFPLYGMLGWSQNQTIEGTTVLRNQPYGQGSTFTVTVVCT